jgi:hypothetical protein
MKVTLFSWNTSIFLPLNKITLASMFDYVVMKWCDMIWWYSIWYDIWYGIWYDMIYYIWYIWYYIIYDMIWYDTIRYDMIYNMMYLLTAVGFPACGSTTVHIYTQTVHRTTQNRQYIEQHKKFGRVRAVPNLCGFYPGIYFTTEEKARKKPQSG